MSFFEETEQHTDNRKDHYIWAERYRPSNFDEYLGNVKLKESIKEYIDIGQIPNILLHSRSPGTGKTSLAKLLANKIPCDSLYINAADETGIENIRNKVTNFAQTLGFNKLKILTLDECQQMSPQGQRALLNVLESCSKHTRFILTCNDVERLIPPLVSRCQVFHVQPPDKAQVAKHVAGILGKENVTYQVSDFTLLMKYHPDIRRIIQTAQQNSISGKLSLSEKQIIESDSKLKLVELLKESTEKKSKIVQCRQLLADAGVSDYSEYFEYLYSHVTDYAPNATANTIMMLAEYQYKDSLVVNKEINFAACLISIIREL